MAVEHFHRSCVMDFYDSFGLPKIESATTLNAFDTMCQKFQMPEEDKGSDMFLMLNKFGDSVLHQAAKSGNVLLIKHIVQLKSETLLAGDEFGWTPLHCAVECQQNESVQVLLELGALVNMATCSPHFRVKSVTVEVPVSTPLWYAAKISRDVNMCKILINHGGIAVPSLDTEGEKVLKQAQKELQETQSEALKDCTSMAIVTIQIVEKYLGHSVC